MYSNDIMVGSNGVRRWKTGGSLFLPKPRLGILRSLYSGRAFSTPTLEKRKKTKKSGGFSKMDVNYSKKRPEYFIDNAYQEAVSRLRVLLAESYTSPINRNRNVNISSRDFDASAGEETDNQSIISAESKASRTRRFYPRYYPSIVSKKYYYPQFKLPTAFAAQSPKIDEPPKYESTIPSEFMSFMERQEDYIEQLEKESKFFKTELSSLLNKVKDVISENENLHERQKSKLLKSVFDEVETEETELESISDSAKKSKSKNARTHFDGPSIVFESRISELEAQLTQAKIDLRKSLEENEETKRKINDGSTATDKFNKKQIETLQRDNILLQETVNKLEVALKQLKNREFDTTDAVKRSLDAAEHAHYEKNAAELEIRRLKDELERQHAKMRDSFAEQSRRIADERNAVERRYSQQIEQLNAELSVQWETTNKSQLELDKQRRENCDLRRENAQKQALIDELKKDMQKKIVALQSDIGVSGAEKSALEQQISTLQLSNERTERHYKQEIIRLQAELQSLRQRSDRADADLIHSRRENLRLMEQVASLEKEIKLNAALSEETATRKDEIVAPSDDENKELGSLIQKLESKHEATVAELETMIKTQNQLMDKLSEECQSLTVKLDEANTRQQEEMWQLQNNLASLKNEFDRTPHPHPQTLHKLEDEGSHSNELEQSEAEQPIEHYSNQENYNPEEYVQSHYEEQQQHQMYDADQTAAARFDQNYYANQRGESQIHANQYAEEQPPPN